MMMNIGCWNVRGLNLRPKQEEIKNVVRSNNLSLFAILESQLRFNKLQSTCNNVLGNGCGYRTKT